ncbi:hypothetical protein J4Q44_G00051010 [Coregonus suidteri]|uniref:Uncharacterized protein n=1 Tax=Coregonus suidteri TaxID=861788 RepID=A0AAN8R709_9TELE
MLSHSSSMAVRSCCILAGTGTSGVTGRSRPSQTCSMGDMSGLSSDFQGVWWRWMQPYSKAGHFPTSRLRPATSRNMDHLMSVSVLETEHSKDLQSLLTNYLPSLQSTEKCLLGHGAPEQHIKKHATLLPAVSRPFPEEGCNGQGFQWPNLVDD